MRRQSWIVLGVAVFFGLIAVYLVNIYLGGAEQRAESKSIQTTRIAVAAVPLDFGTRITAQNVRFVDWPVDSVPQGAFRDMAELNPAGRDHVVLRPILAGEPVLRSRLSGEGGRASLSALLPPDMRAAAIRISDVQGVAGFALPGDRVDVLLTRQSGEEQVTSMLASNVRLIAVDQDANENSERATLGRTATLEVTQEDAQKLALGGAVGTLSLVLRSVRAGAQETIAYDSPIRSSDLAGGVYIAPQMASAAASSSPPARGRAPRIMRRRPGPAPARNPSVEVVRGTEPREYEVKTYAGR